MAHQIDKNAWFALRVRSNFERKIGDLLPCKGQSVFMPIGLKNQRGRSGVKESTQPLTWIPSFVASTHMTGRQFGLVWRSFTSLGLAGCPFLLIGRNRTAFERG